MGWIDDETGVFDLRIDSEAPALKGVGTLLADIYSGADPVDVIETEPVFVEELKIDQNLTPTRLRGLGNIRKQIVEFAKKGA